MKNNRIYQDFANKQRASWIARLNKNLEHPKSAVFFLEAKPLNQQTKARNQNGAIS